MLRGCTRLVASLAVLVSFSALAPLDANIVGGQGSNGQPPRPFYIVAHNPNRLSEADAALQAGANALEPDVMKFSIGTTVLGFPNTFVNDYAGGSGLFMYHDDVVITTRIPDTVEAYLEHVRSRIMQGWNVALITFDVKSPAAPYVAYLHQAVRAHLNYGGLQVQVMYSVGTFADALHFRSIYQLLDDNEGIMVDGEYDAGMLLNCLHWGNVNCRWTDGLGQAHEWGPPLAAPRVGYGNGHALVGLGLAPSILPSIDFAAWVRAGGFGGVWDRQQFLFGGSGRGWAIPYAYPIQVGTPPFIGRLATALITNGVDGLIPDDPVPDPTNFESTTNQIRNLRDYIVNWDPNHYIARGPNPGAGLLTAADSPYYVPPDSYAIRARTTSGLTDGSSATITFTLTGECGTASISIDGDFSHRFARSEETYVTLPSRNLGRLSRLTLSSGSSDSWRVGQVHVSSVRWGVDFGDHHMVDFGAASVDNGSWPSLSLGGWGSPCDNDPPAANPVHTPPANGAGWNNTAVTVNWNWTDPLVSPPEIKLPGGLVIGGGPPHASGIRPVTCQTTTTSASVEGETEMVASCADVEYNRGEARHFVRIDRTPPVVHCAAADGQWHAADVSLPCTGADALSGLVNPGDHQFSLTTSVPANTETAAALTGSRTVADLAGNTTTAPAIGGNRVDKKSPIIGIVQPAATTYTHSATLVLDYGVTDGGSGVAAVVPAIDGSTTVAGNPLPNGRAIPLVSSLPLGTHTFTIAATDAVGNTSNSSVTFTIIVTAESIMESVAQLMQAGGGVEQRGNSLMGILANAAANRRVGNCRAAANQYNAFIKHVQAQTSKSIAPVAAAILIADAQYLIAHCP